MAQPIVQRSNMLTILQPHRRPVRITNFPSVVLKQMNFSISNIDLSANNFCYYLEKIMFEISQYSNSHSLTKNKTLICAMEIRANIEK